MSSLDAQRTIKVNRTAELLLWSRNNHTRLQGLPPDLIPRDLDEAYEIQAALMSLRGTPLAGFKLGLTNEKAQRAADTFSPIVGRLAANDIYRGSARIALPRKHLRIVEAELVFELGSDLPAGHAPYSEQRVITSLSRVFAGIEVCNTRFEDNIEPSLARLVADNSNADLIVVGDPLSAADLAGLSDLAVTLQWRGHPDVKGSTRNVLGNPLRALTWLANWLARRGEGLKRGQLVSSGSCTGMTELSEHDCVTACFGSGARVSVELSVASAEKTEVKA
jgi:2-keto-4-pentenoate hydratase